MRVLVTGCLTFNDRDWLWSALDYLNSMSPITEIVEDSRPGAGVRAQEWAHSRERRCTAIPLRWSEFGRDALVMQHTELCKTQPSVVLVCPGASVEFLAIAKAHGLKVIHLDKMPVAKSPS